MGYVYRTAEIRLLAKTRVKACFVTKMSDPEIQFSLLVETLRF